MPKERIKKIIDKYIQKLIENKIDVEKVILFGSYAKGLSSKGSDLDLCVVSKNFGKDRIFQNTEII